MNNYKFLYFISFVLLLIFSCQNSTKKEVKELVKSIETETLASDNNSQKLNQEKPIETVTTTIDNNSQKLKPKQPIETKMTDNNSQKLKPKQSIKTETTTNNNSENLKPKQSIELFGKWTIINTLTNSSYQYEIYKKGDGYTGVIGKNKMETLKKRGNKYSVVGNKYGEYYMINSAKEMTLFDKDGELTSAGYKAIKQ